MLNTSLEILKSFVWAFSLFSFFYLFFFFAFFLIIFLLDMFLLPFNTLHISEDEKYSAIVSRFTKKDTLLNEKQ